MADIFSWVATVATIGGALLTASNVGARITGTGFAVFTVGSLCWLATGFMTDQPALLWTNAILTFLNLFGVWRWLGRQAKVEEGARSASDGSHDTPGEALFSVSLLSKAAVQIGDETVGHCVDAMAGCGSGRVTYVTVSEGGVAGIGDTFRKLPWSLARFDGDRLVVRSGLRRLSNLPEMSKDDWPAS
jgi:hypothetical protein